MSEQNKPKVSFQEALRERESQPRARDRPELTGSAPLVIALMEALEELPPIPYEETDEPPTGKGSVPDA